MARLWNWQKWGSASDPIHKSDLNGLIGKFGCLEQFKRKKIERAAIGARVYENAGGKLCAGNAVHSVIHRILRSKPAVIAMLDETSAFADGTMRRGYDEEFERERAGRVVDWYRDKPDKVRDDCVAMLVGLLADMRNHVGEVVLPEAGFVYHVDGIWLTGATDLVYRAPDSPYLSLCDWKTGVQLPHQIELDHGWEAGIYGNAVRSAYFVPFENVTPEPGEAHRDAMERECIRIAEAWQAVIDSDENQETIPGIVSPSDRLAETVEELGAVRFGEYPDRIRHVHMRDYIPYTRAGSKMLSRPEEMEWAGLVRPEKSAYVKGDTRGPGWYRVQRSEGDTPRLRHLLRSVVSWVRMGKFPPAPGEMCSRCKFRQPCLLDGYKPVGAEKKQLTIASRGFDFDGFGDGSEI